MSNSSERAALPHAGEGDPLGAALLEALARDWAGMAGEIERMGDRLSEQALGGAPACSAAIQGCDSLRQRCAAYSRILEAAAARQAGADNREQVLTAIASVPVEQTRKTLLAAIGEAAQGAAPDSQDADIDWFDDPSPAPRP